MRCPKCHYLSFDPEPRCRNCGYGLSLEEADVFIREDEQPPSPFADLAIHPASELAAGAATVVTATTSASTPQARYVPSAPPSDASTSPAQSPFAELHSTLETADRPAAPPVHAPIRRPEPTTELPLFVRGTSSAELARTDEPLVRLPAETRAPLSVRRKVADAATPRPRSVPSAADRLPGPLDRDLLADLQQIEERTRKAARVAAAGDEEAFRAGAGKRLLAAGIDGILLGAVSAAVMWITLRWCGLPLDRALMLPVLVPTSAFLVLVGVGYLVLFTAAGGQTLGKMAAGIRVIGDAPAMADRGPIGLGQAVLRATLALPSILAAGIGFVPALVGDERALHDRLARTRVVRA
jgi:uncharacterized RDD family membrane protein YckC